MNCTVDFAPFDLRLDELLQHKEDKVLTYPEFCGLMLKMKSTVASFDSLSKESFLSNRPIALWQKDCVISYQISADL